ncbi:MAG: UDP-N-acetylmuramate--L-alanine ligase [Acidimicrobiales bacterium]
MSTPPLLDLENSRHVHVVGVGGTGMSAIAAVLASMGHNVTGSDIKVSANLARLGASGVTVWVGHSADHLDTAEVVVASSAVPPGNLELAEARLRGLPVLSRADVLSALLKTKRTVAVAGTHGKTTTASMLALTTASAGMQPSFLIGGELNEIGSGAVWDVGDWLILEADESDGTFLALRSQVAIVTSVEADHLEYYGSMANLVSAFRTFLDKVDGTAIVCADFPEAAHLGESCGASTYGTSKTSEWRIVDIRSERTSTSFGLEHHNVSVGQFVIPVPGTFNARNATATIVAGLSLGVSLEQSRLALARFAGVARRYQFRGQRNGVTFVDDYAHLASEVEAALDAASKGGWARIVCVYQPHRFSRTETLWESFASAFLQAEVTLIMDVYPAGELPRPGVSGELVAKAVLGAHPLSDVSYVPSRVEVLERLRVLLQPGDLCLMLGAGDVGSLIDEIEVGAQL